MISCCSAFSSRTGIIIINLFKLGANSATLPLISSICASCFRSDSSISLRTLHTTNGSLAILARSSNSPGNQQPGLTYSDVASFPVRRQFESSESSVDLSYRRLATKRKDVSEGIHILHEPNLKIIPTPRFPRDAFIKAIVSFTVFNSGFVDSELNTLAGAEPYLEGVIGDSAGSDGC